ncbi:hypothetical protein BDW75DRAFT_117826 [Aspergillus navahoensis]
MSSHDQQLTRQRVTIDDSLMAMLMLMFLGLNPSRAATDAKKQKPLKVHRAPAKFPDRSECWALDYGCRWSAAGPENFQYGVSQQDPQPKPQPNFQEPRMRSSRALQGEGDPRFSSF